MSDALVSAGHRLADAAKAGDWPAVTKVLDHEWSWLVINQWRPGGTAWFTALHQSAWTAHPATSSQNCWKGRAADPAGLEGADGVRRGGRARPHTGVAGTAAAAALAADAGEDRALDARLAELIDGRVRGRVFEGDLGKVLRYPPVEILHELPGQRVWFPLPAKYGFHIELQRGALEVKSWCGLVEGSGQAHLVTPEGSVLVDQGFV